MWGEAYAFAEAHNITVVGGSDKNVGVAGGWLQVCSAPPSITFDLGLFSLGGWSWCAIQLHGIGCRSGCTLACDALCSANGLMITLQLEFKMVTPDGKFRTVNACQNEDLFFALRGGMI